jgi:hypothetical protein
MVVDPTNIRSLFDIVIRANELTGGQLLAGFFVGLNMALLVRYSNRRNGLTFIGLLTAFIGASLLMLLRINTWYMIAIGLLETLIGLFLVTQESQFTAP